MALKCTMETNIPATRLLRMRSAAVRRSMKTSASSIRSTASHLRARLNMVVRFPSTSEGDVPMSLGVNTIRGRRVKPEMHSKTLSQRKDNCHGSRNG